MSIFDETVMRQNIGNMKDLITPDVLKQHGIVSFAAAEMDFKTAPSVMESISAIVQRGIYGFTIPTREYYDAVIWWHREMRDWAIQKEWIVPTLGTIYSVAEAIRMTSHEGESIIVQTPVYYRYEQAARRQNRKTVHNRLKIVNGRYEMDFADLEEKMADPNNKLLILCNAHNPIGRVWTRQELQEVERISRKYEKLVLSDEIFGEMVFTGQSATPYASIPEGQDYAITVTSLGKAFNFTGVNHAHAIIPNERLRARFEMQKYADHYGSVGPFEYAAVLGAYSEAGRQWFEAVRDYIGGNAEYTAQFLRSRLPQTHLFATEGTSVCWVDWSFLGLQGQALHDFFPHEALFAVETGEVYGEGCGSMTRINLSSPRKQVQDALERVYAAIEKKGFAHEAV